MGLGWLRASGLCSLISTAFSVSCSQPSPAQPRAPPFQKQNKTKHHLCSLRSPKEAQRKQEKETLSRPITRKWISLRGPSTRGSCRRGRLSLAVHLGAAIVEVALSQREFLETQHKQDTVSFLFQPDLPPPQAPAFLPLGFSPVYPPRGSLGGEKGL